MSVSAGVQFDGIHAECRAGVQLFGIGVEKQADDDASILEPADGIADFCLRSRDVEATLGGHFFAPLGNQRRLVGQCFAGDFHDILGAGEFQVDGNCD